MKLFLLISLAALFLSVVGFAQSRDSSRAGEPTMILTGVVYDINGSVIVSGTKIIAYNSAGRKYESATSDEGFYRFDLPLAIYKIEASAPGFCPRQIQDFRVINSTHGKMSLDFVLEVAGPCRQEKIIEEQPKRKTKKKSRPIIIAMERKLNVRTNG
jgi:hypothetical protein